MTTTKYGQKNCQTIAEEHKSVFYSYTTPVCVIQDGHVYVTNQKHSVTTSRHINMWLREVVGNWNVEYVSQDAIDTMAQGIA